MFYIIINFRLIIFGLVRWWKYICIHKSLISTGTEMNNVLSLFLWLSVYLSVCIYVCMCCHFCNKHWNSLRTIIELEVNGWMGTYITNARCYNMLIYDSIQDFPINVLVSCVIHSLFIPLANTVIGRWFALISISNFTKCRLWQSHHMLAVS